MWQPQPIAALITAIASILVTVGTGLYFNRKLEEFRTRTGRTLQEHQHQLTERAAYRTARRDRLAVLLNTASMARSAAGELLGTADLASDRQHELLRRTATAFQQLSTFFAEVSNAQTNQFLTRKDIEKVNSCQFEIMRMFFALDLDAGGNAEYKTKLDQCFQAVDNAFQDFRTHYLAVQEKIAAEVGQD